MKVKSIGCAPVPTFVAEDRDEYFAVCWVLCKLPGHHPLHLWCSGQHGEGEATWRLDIQGVWGADSYERCVDEEYALHLLGNLRLLRATLAYAGDLDPVLAVARSSQMGRPESEEVEA